MSATTAAVPTATTTKKVDLTELQPNDVFSESSHYVYEGKKTGSDANGRPTTLYQFKHLESGNLINLDGSYVENLLQTADQYQDTVEVGREDKHWTAKQIEDAKKKGELPADSSVREGDVRVKGIRSIWADIHTERVFTVCFNKQSKELTAKALNEAKNKQLQEALTELLSSVSSGSLPTSKAEEVIKNIQNNPVLSTLPGEERELRGYKVQFHSLNGFYDVVDMAIPNTGKNENLRKVNINEINWLVVDGVKYIVK